MLECYSKTDTINLMERDTSRATKKAQDMILLLNSFRLDLTILLNIISLKCLLKV
jgi:hypothetical protein